MQVNSNSNPFSIPISIDFPIINSNPFSINNNNFEYAAIESNPFSTAEIINPFSIPMVNRLLLNMNMNIIIIIII